MRPHPCIIAPFLASALLWTGCETATLPPGEVVGTFAFEATLDPTQPDACRIDGVSETLSFNGVLAWDGDKREAWMQIDGALRLGSLEGADFEVGLEPLPDGSVRAIPRRLAACSCELLLVERIAGTLVRSASTCNEEVKADEILNETSCPRLDEEGEPAWDTCGGICGSLREQVRFAETDCTCEDGGVAMAVPEAGCTLHYELRGTRVGDRE